MAARLLEPVHPGEILHERLSYAARLDEYARALGGAQRGLYFPLQKGW